VRAHGMGLPGPARGASVDRPPHAGGDGRAPAPGHEGDRRLARPLSLGSMPFLTRPDGCRIYYELDGDRGAPPLVLLDVAADRVDGWRRNVPTLAAELQVAVIDPRGNGSSDEPPGPSTMATFVEDAVALMDAIGWRRAHVYGQSFGGMVAQELALTEP